MGRGKEAELFSLLRALTGEAGKGLTWGIEDTTKEARRSQRGDGFSKIKYLLR